MEHSSIILDDKFMPSLDSIFHYFFFILVYILFFSFWFFIVLFYSFSSLNMSESTDSSQLQSQITLIPQEVSTEVHTPDDMTKKRKLDESDHMVDVSSSFSSSSSSSSSSSPPSSSSSSSEATAATSATSASLSTEVKYDESESNESKSKKQRIDSQKSETQQENQEDKENQENQEVVDGIEEGEQQEESNASSQLDWAVSIQSPQRLISIVNITSELCEFFPFIIEHSNEFQGLIIRAVSDNKTMLIDARLHCDVKVAPAPKEIKSEENSESTATEHRVFHVQSNVFKILASLIKDRCSIQWCSLKQAGDTMLYVEDDSSNIQQMELAYVSPSEILSSPDPGKVLYTYMVNLELSTLKSFINSIAKLEGNSIEIMILEKQDEEYLTQFFVLEGKVKTATFKQVFQCQTKVQKSPDKEQSYILRTISEVDVQQNSKKKENSYIHLKDSCEIVFSAKFLVASLNSYLKNIGGQQITLGLQSNKPLMFEQNMGDGQSYIKIYVSSLEDSETTELES